MRLWHEALIPYLPRAQLLGQHRECCALRGNSWGKKHATVNYVFEYPYEMLYTYHLRVMEEMHRRGYKTNTLWHHLEYRGKNANPLQLGREVDYGQVTKSPQIESENPSGWIYPEHNSDYLKECLENLERKGIKIAFRSGV